MKKMAGSHQLIAITHLPQIAARGAAHYHVFKDNSADKTVSNIRLLNKNERIHEIAQMIGGARPSATTLAGARELVEGRPSSARLGSI
jgi:DNA repair protein RecN (Recombination protein N)